MQQHHGSYWTQMRSWSRAIRNTGLRLYSGAQQQWAWHSADSSKRRFSNILSVNNNRKPFKITVTDDFYWWICPARRVKSNDLETKMTWMCPYFSLKVATESCVMENGHQPIKTLAQMQKENGQGWSNLAHQLHAVGHTVHLKNVFANGEALQR